MFDKNSRSTYNNWHNSSSVLKDVLTLPVCDLVFQYWDEFQSKELGGYKIHRDNIVQCMRPVDILYSK